MIGCSGAGGLTLIFFGVLFLLENLGVSDNLVGRYWPVILIILGAISLFNLQRFRVRWRRYRSQRPPYIDGEKM